MTTPRWIDRAARGVATWARNHPDAAGPGGPGDGQAKTIAVAGLLWFCMTLAIAAILAGAVTVASGEEAALITEIDWTRFALVMLAAVAVLNVPVWVLAWRRVRRASGARGAPSARN